MSKKRFVGRYTGRTIKKLIGIEDIETNKVCITIEENIQLLNELNDENEELKKENKKLKVRINTFTEGNKTLQARLKEVSTENKNTKAVLKDFMDILNKIQVNSTDGKLLNVARDMLQHMGKELRE